MLQGECMCVFSSVYEFQFDGVSDHFGYIFYLEFGTDALSMARNRSCINIEQ